MKILNGNLAPKEICKIEFLHNIYFYSNMYQYTPFDELESGREYYILTYNGKKNKGIFYEYKYSYMSGYKDTNAWFQIKTLLDFYTDDDEFYDVKEIRENSQKAIQQMEQRSLNMILKRLVNEEFEWL